MRYTGWAMSALVFLLELATADARPGGGHSYSGGGGFSGGGSSGGGSGGGSSGGGDVLFLLVHLLIRYPQIGVPVLAVVVVMWLLGKRERSRNADWDSGPPVVQPRSVSLERIARVDPEFSRVVFDDFVYRLYARAHGSRNDDHAMRALAPYLSAEARAQLQARPPRAAVSGVVIGAMRVIEVEVPAQATNNGQPTFITVTLEVEANMTAQGETHYVVERWSLRRSAAARSRAPSATNTFPCPNCGAPFQSADDARCNYCGEVVTTGLFDWLVVSTHLLHDDTRGPTLTGHAPERGTELPTITQSGVQERWVALQRDDPALTDESFAARLHHIYHQLNSAWVARELSGARPYVSDGMFGYLQYWIDSYRVQRLRNCMDDARMHHWTFAKLTRDRYFDAATVRIWALAKDYTLTEDGKLVGGSKSLEREYSEYWTLVRSAARRGQAHDAKACPNCGAPLNIDVAGSCEYCGAHVTGGEFDWVLSRIEQDDSYRG